MAEEENLMDLREAQKAPKKIRPPKSAREVALEKENKALKERIAALEEGFSFEQLVDQLIADAKLYGEAAAPRLARSRQAVIDRFTAAEEKECDC